MATIRQHLGGRFWIEVQATNIRDIFIALQPFQEVFNDKECGKCGSPELVTDHRTDVKGNDYFSLKCLSCRSQLDFGCHKKGGTIYPRRKLENGEWDGTHRGWYHYKDRKPREPSQEPPEGQGPPADQQTY